MKANTVIAIFVTTLSFAVTGQCIEQQATYLGSRLAPRSLNTPVSSNVSITQNVSITPGDVNEKNFTFDELFTLQKQFLDNFIAPKNDIQVRFIFQTSILLVLNSILGEVHQFVTPS